MLRLLSLLLLLTVGSASVSLAQHRKPKPARNTHTEASFMTLAEMARADSTRADSAALKVSEGEFVDLREEPNPITPIEKLIVYPQDAMRSGLEGKVVVDALVSSLGSVVRVKVLQSSNAAFDDAATSAMKKARFTPAIGSDGKPRAVWITRSINFRLR